MMTKSKHKFEVHCKLILGSFSLLFRLPLANHLCNRDFCRKWNLVSIVYGQLPRSVVTKLIEILRMLFMKLCTNEHLIIITFLLLKLPNLVLSFLLFVDFLHILELLHDFVKLSELRTHCWFIRLHDLVKLSQFRTFWFSSLPG